MADANTPSSSGDILDHVYIESMKESFVPKTYETEDSQNCSTPKIETNGSDCLKVKHGTENLSGAVEFTSPDNNIYNWEVFEFAKKNKTLDAEVFIDAFKREFDLFNLDTDALTIHNRLMKDVCKKVAYKLKSAKKRNF